MKESLYRALRTFVQTALGYVVVNVAVVDFSVENQALKTALLGLLISAISAGIAGVMNIQGGAGSNDVWWLGKK